MTPPRNIQNESFAYLDYAATSPLAPEAAEALKPYLISGSNHMQLGANANSVHTAGRAAFTALEQARHNIAKLLGAKRPDEIIFTSGATEANNAALVGITAGLAAVAHINDRRAIHLVTDKIEHDSILEPARRLATSGCDVTFLRPDATGRISPTVLDQTLATFDSHDAILVSIQAANSEIGTIQPIRELCEVAHARGAHFHSDATQLLGKAPCEISELGVDAASFSAHKIGGPKGVGALYLKARTPFQALLLGGGQEAAHRSGTQNVPGIIGFAAALEPSVVNLPSETKRLRALRSMLVDALQRMPGVRITISESIEGDWFLSNIVHVLVPGIESETLILRLDRLGFAVSGGSACASQSLEPSHVLKALGIQDDLALCALRISFGRFTTEQEITRLIAAIPRIIT